MFSTKRHGNSIIISNDQRSASNPQQSYEVAMGENFYTEGTHIYRIRIDACVYVGVGKRICLNLFLPPKGNFH